MPHHRINKYTQFRYMRYPSRRCSSHSRQDVKPHATQLNMHARSNDTPSRARYYSMHARFSIWHARPWHASARLARSCHGNFLVPGPPRWCHTTPSRSSRFWRAICTRSSKRWDTRVYTPSSRCMWTMGRTVCCFAGMGMGWWAGRLRAFWSL